MDEQNQVEYLGQRVIEVRLANGETLRAELPGDGVGVLEAIYQNLGNEFVQIGADLILRSADVRQLRICERKEASGGGFLDVLRHKVGGGQMSSYEYDRISEGQQHHQGGPGEASMQQQGVGQQGGMPYGTAAGARRGAGGGLGVGDYMGYGRRPWMETKPFFLTSEFLTLVVLIVAVLLASALSDDVPQRLAWTLVTALGGTYMLSRGIAKCGSREPNPTMHQGGGR